MTQPIETQNLLEDSLEANEAYQFFMRPDPNQRKFLGPIEHELDPVTGLDAMYRMALIGMTRNAAEEDKLETKVYLGFDGKHVHPHLRLDDAKPLQGWYQPKNNDKPNSRPRPCFSEAMLTQPYGGYCLAPGSQVQTQRGLVAVEDILPGDGVLGEGVEGLELTPVIGWIKRECTDGLYRVSTADGFFDVTGDHPVFVRGVNKYVNAADLKVGDHLQARDLRYLSPSFSDGQELQYPQVLPRAQIRQVKDAGASGWVAEFFDDNLGLQESGVLPGAGQAIGNPLPFLPCGESNSKREEPTWQDLGTTAVRNGDQGEIAPSELGQETHSGNQAEVCPANQGRGNGAEVLPKDGAPGYPDAVKLGGTSGAVLGLTGDSVGVRTGSANPPDWASVRARLPAGHGGVRGGEGLYGSKVLGKDTSSEVCGVCGTGVGRKIHEEFGSAVISIEKLPSVEVYDIQTPVENFYVDGGKNSYLIHNCPVGCRFCYINSGFRGYRGSGLITVPANYGDQVAKQLDKLKYGSAGYFSSFTDPFIELEEHYHNTQSGAEAFVSRGLPVFFLSRKSYPGWAFDLLQHSLYSYAQKSLNTGVDADFHKLSPGAMTLSDHIEEVCQLRKAGIYTSIQVNPVVPGITSHEDILTLFERLAEAGNNHVIVKFVEAGYSWAPAMVERLTKAFGAARAGEFAKLFTENQPGSQRTIAWEYRQEAHNLYRAWATRLGMTYATCYEYRKVNGKAVSVGREYTTAAQCHGQRVPMFKRNPKEYKFTEIEECPPTGCLYCADDNAGEARCGVSKFGNADALRVGDYRNPVKPSKLDAIKVTTA